MTSSRPCPCCPTLDLPRSYLSHFRSIHRGAYFAELRTTTVRKLLPESWGFLCPVHTPDGSPCGLLNHFTAACRCVARAGSENGMGPRHACAPSWGSECAGSLSCTPDPPDLDTAAGL